ncbi:hypothetical protein OKJ48_44050 [Streptomyces kunmingensis]|uniref:Uncharacterized protein n=1 Tax=Streptomyces kunmingensis TaxID=68225 RepID=A0ABU6CSE5_9ACTN|nr:hypothetical protein [Streptomyces kunmingensis]MEB3967161.1 hypothetical protein [Streptomyces kunmingensis]
MAEQADLRQHLLTQVVHDPMLSILDRTPVPICRFARVSHCFRLREAAA